MRVSDSAIGSSTTARNRLVMISKSPTSKALRSRNFASNALMKGQRNVWFPDHALGAGCAKWAIDSARAFADE
jgi:hypothetical protein